MITGKCLVFVLAGLTLAGIAGCESSPTDPNSLSAANSSQNGGGKQLNAVADWLVVRVDHYFDNPMAPGDDVQVRYSTKPELAGTFVDIFVSDAPDRKPYLTIHAWIPGGVPGNSSELYGWISAQVDPDGNGIPGDQTALPGDHPFYN